jgi:hypothetical protein
MSFLYKEIVLWDYKEVLQWLESKNIKNLIEIFSKQRINGYDLCFLTNEDLKNELGIIKLHDRMKVLREIRKTLITNCIIFIYLIK